ncbi:MAG: GIY-YIG nuclease family protein [Patescibacteria group bacterium]
MYFVYCIYNKKHNKIYIGQTDNIIERIKLHNERVFKHCYTYRFDGEWILEYKEGFITRQEALKREKQLKSYRGRQFVWNLIKQKYSRVAQR